MTFFDSIILGLVEGITEFLPISSTAHLIMTSKILGLNQTPFLKSFEIVIQLGAIAAVLVIFARQITKNPIIIKKVGYAFLPTAVIGFALYKFIKGYLIGNLSIAMWSLIIGGLALIVIERFYLRYKSFQPTILDIQSLSNRQAFFIGIVQSVSVIPGVSRAAATIIPTLCIGASRRVAAEFSFLLAVPTIAAAAGYDLLKNISVLSLEGNLTLLITGFLVSFFAALFSVRFLLSYITTHSFIPFGIYRIIIAIVFFLLFIR